MLELKNKSIESENLFDEGNSNANIETTPMKSSHDKNNMPEDHENKELQPEETEL